MSSTRCHQNETPLYRTVSRGFSLANLSTLYREPRYAEKPARCAAIQKSVQGHRKQLRPIGRGVPSVNIWKIENGSPLQPEYLAALVVAEHLDEVLGLLRTEEIRRGIDLRLVTPIAICLGELEGLRRGLYILVGNK